jgi:hypothetical protein
MPTSIKLNLTLISAVLGILGSLFTATYFVYQYHGTLATKESVNLIFIEVKLNAVEYSIETYDNETELTDVEKRRYDRLTGTLERLEASRDKIMGLGQ